MRNTVPLSTVVLNDALVGSAKPSLSTGKPLVDHTTQDEAPGRFEMTLVAISSISTMARPFGVWPVTTRRICRLMSVPSLMRPAGSSRARAFGAGEKFGEDRRDPRLCGAPFVTVPFLEQIVVAAPLDDVVVKLAVGQQ